MWSAFLYSVRSAWEYAFAKAGKARYPLKGMLFVVAGAGFAYILVDFWKAGDRMIQSFTPAFAQRLLRRPNAWAAIRGGEDWPKLVGTLKLYQTTAGVLAAAEFWGLPGLEKNPDGIFALHIHQGDSCASEGGKEFAGAKGHRDNQNRPHPQHMGDLPPVFSNRGYGWGAFLTSRFTIREVLGCTVILHAARDDFTTQPSGAPGAMIACGVIKSQ